MKKRDVVFGICNELNKECVEINNKNIKERCDDMSDATITKYRNEWCIQRQQSYEIEMAYSDRDKVVEELNAAKGIIIECKQRISRLEEVVNNKDEKLVKQCECINELVSKLKESESNGKKIIYLFNKIKKIERTINSQAAVNVKAVKKEGKLSQQLKERLEEIVLINKENKQKKQARKTS